MFTLAELIADRNYIEENNGNLPVEEGLYFYDKYMNGAVKYLLGVELDGRVIGFFCSVIDPHFCSCQTDHKANVQYLRFRPHTYGAREIAARDDVIDFGSTEEVYSLYRCNNKKGYNSGYCFEKAVFNHYGVTDWTQDNKPSTKGGDIRLNGEEIQLKFVEKNSLATITSTKKILRQINKLIKEAA